MKGENNLCFCNLSNGRWASGGTPQLQNHIFIISTSFTRGIIQNWTIFSPISVELQGTHHKRCYHSSVFYQTLPEATRWGVIPWSLWLGYLHSRATRTCGPYFELAHIPTALWALGVASVLHLWGEWEESARLKGSFGLSPGFVPTHHTAILGVTITSASIKKIIPYGTWL